MAKVLSRARKRRVRKLSKFAQVRKGFVKFFVLQRSRRAGAEEHTMAIFAIVRTAVLTAVTATLVACGGGGGTPEPQAPAAATPPRMTALAVKQVPAKEGDPLVVTVAYEGSGASAMVAATPSCSGAPAARVAAASATSPIPVPQGGGEVPISGAWREGDTCTVAMTGTATNPAGSDTRSETVTFTLPSPPSAKGFVGLASQVVGENPLGVFVVKGDTCATATFEWARNATTHNVGAPIPLINLWVNNTQKAPGKVFLSGSWTSRVVVELDVASANITDYVGEAPNGTPDDPASGWETSATVKPEHLDPAIGQYAVHASGGMTLWVDRFQSNTIYCRNAAGVDKVVYTTTVDGLYFKYFRYFGM